MSTILNNDELIKAHAKVLMSYVGAFVFAVGLQLHGKIRAMLKYKADKKKAEANGEDTKLMHFNRYTDSDSYLLATDRAVGNYVEWAPAFLTLFATHASVAGDCTTLGWAYVMLRYTYPILAVSGGISKTGARPLIFLATMPMYGILALLGYGIFKKL